LTALIKEQAGRDGLENKKNDGDAMGGVAGGMASRFRVVSRRSDVAAHEMRLVVDRDVAGNVSSLVNTLFAVEELSADHTRIHPLTRQQRGIIDSAANLSYPQGSAVRVASPLSGMPYAFFTFCVRQNQASSAGI